MSSKGRVVISRRVGERIFIGDDVEIMVTFARGGKATLNVLAPKSVVIDRPSLEVDASDRRAFSDWLGVREW